MIMAAALIGTVAWGGHGVAGSGIPGAVHLGSDVLHLIGAAAWIGALIPLAVALRAIGTHRSEPSLAFAQRAILHFSTLGIVSVNTILLTGLINTWMLVGSVSALIGSAYGRLLLVKIGIFIAMVSVAAVNRMVLTPRLLHADAGVADMTLSRLMKNALGEAALGGVILFVVGVLGTLQPAIEQIAQ